MENDSTWVPISDPDGEKNTLLNSPFRVYRGTLHCTPRRHRLDIDSCEIVNARTEETFRDVLARSFSLIESIANHITPFDGSVPFHRFFFFVSLLRWELQ